MKSEEGKAKLQRPMPASRVIANQCALPPLKGVLGVSREAQRSRDGGVRCGNPPLSSPPLHSLHALYEPEHSYIYKKEDAR